MVLIGIYKQKEAEMKAVHSTTQLVIYVGGWGRIPLCNLASNLPSSCLREIGAHSVDTNM